MKDPEIPGPVKAILYRHRSPSPFLERRHQRDVVPARHINSRTKLPTLSTIPGKPTLSAETVGILFAEVFDVSADRIEQQLAISACLEK